MCLLSGFGSGGKGPGSRNGKLLAFGHGISFTRFISVVRSDVEER